MGGDGPAGERTGGGWTAGIALATETVANHLAAGQGSLASLYSGNTAADNGGVAAYRVGAGCSDKVKYLTNKLTALGASATSLYSPCYLGSDGNYYQKQ